MRIAIFEWICGGGMHHQVLEEIPPSLMVEGWAMLSTLVQMLQASEHQVVSVIDRRLVSPTQLASLPTIQCGSFITLPVSAACSAVDQTIEVWLSYFIESRAELALIIAPEIDGILQQTISVFRNRGIPVLNCSGPFLDRACDKWLTATTLDLNGISHPETFLASDWVPGKWRASGRWCLKSRLGAGCEGMRVGDSDHLSLKIEQLPEPGDWIVQPWLAGEAFSCSAIVDHLGHAAWFPLVTQRFELLSDDNLETLQYQGGKTIARDSGPRRPDDLLDKLLKALCVTRGEALGWISADLLLQPDGQWVVIEVNPRLTTSILGLSQAAPFNLAQVMITAFSRGLQTFTDSPLDYWRSVEFTPKSSGLVDRFA